MTLNPQDALTAPLKIRLSYSCPPIPDRRFDWCAVIDGDEERGILGFGSTPTEAVQEALASEPDLFHENDWTVTVTQPARAEVEKQQAQARGRVKIMERQV